MSELLAPTLAADAGHPPVGRDEADASSDFIIVVDLETTGFDAAPELGGHAPIEVGRCDLLPGRDLFGRPVWGDSAIKGPQSQLLNPGRSIPPESSAVHHLIACDLIETPPWREGLIWRIGGVRRPAAFAAHNAKFERQWCVPELVGPAPWVCTWKAALRAWPDAPGHSNQCLRYWLNPQGLDRELASPAHRAGPDAYVTAFLLRELLRLHPLETLIQWSDEPAVLIRVPFGKRPEEGGSRGLRWSEVDDGFLEWTVERDFSDDILHTVKLEIARRNDEYRRRRAEEDAAIAAQGGDYDDQVPF